MGIGAGVVHACLRSSDLARRNNVRGLVGTRGEEEVGVL